MKTARKKKADLFWVSGDEAEQKRKRRSGLKILIIDQAGQLIMAPSTNTIK